MASEAKIYSLAEVQEHNKPEDLWVVIFDKVYDLTKFQKEVS
jgi:cytochrome b involved in lipid metabolism